MAEIHLNTKAGVMGVPPAAKGGLSSYLSPLYKILCVLPQINVLT